MQKSYFVYILSSLSRVIYIGVTNNMVRRVFEHKQGLYEGFTKKYKVKYLMYYEEYPNINDAISREKQLKSWSRKKKCSLVEHLNPGWQELSL